MVYLFIFSKDSRLECISLEKVAYIICFSLTTFTEIIVLDPRIPLRGNLSLFYVLVLGVPASDCPLS